MPLEVRRGYRGCWELNAGPFRKPARLLTPEPSPQPCCFSYKMSERVPAGLWGVLIVAVPQWGTVSYCPRVWQSSVNAIGAWTVWKSKLQPNPGTIRDLQINFISFGSKVSKTERENSCLSLMCVWVCVGVRAQVRAWVCIQFTCMNTCRKHLRSALTGRKRLGVGEASQI